MVLSRRLKRALAWLLAACMMVAQTAAVAYACSRGEASAAAEAVAVTPCAAHLAAEGQASVEGDGPLAKGNVCEVHCQTASLPDSGAFDLPSVVAVARWEVPPLDAMGGIPAPAPELEARSAAPPLLALFPRLLI